MEYIGLGRTGLRVSVAGLGCGGFSQLGLGRGKSEAEAVALMHRARDLGVNLFDTAAAYGTEAVLGKALEAVRREEVVIATKAPFNVSNPNSSAASAVASLDNSLRRLATDYIDVYQLHGVAPAAYDHARNVIAPALLKEKAKGKFCHLGISETAPNDPEHKMLQRAAADGVWDVAMVGFHMMHQNARKAVSPLTRQHRVGTLLMFAVRNIFSRPGQLAATMQELAAAGEVPRCLAETDNPLGFLIYEGGPGASSTPPIASRGTSPVSMSCCSEPAIPSICAATSPRCSLRHCRKRTAPASRASSATWSGSGWTRRIWRAASAPDAARI